MYSEMSERGSPVGELAKTNGNGGDYGLGGSVNGGTMVDTVPDLSPEWIQAWKGELTRALEKGGAVDEKLWSDPMWVQAQIDKRCVENMRMLVVDSVDTAKAGHPGLPMGITEVGYVLYKYAMRYNPENPGWFNRDRFVLSAGHGCLLQYVCLHLAGFGVEVRFSAFKPFYGTDASKKLFTTFGVSPRDMTSICMHRTSPLAPCHIEFFRCICVVSHRPKLLQNGVKMLTVQTMSKNTKELLIAIKFLWIDKRVGFDEVVNLWFVSIKYAFLIVQVEDLKRLCLLGSKTPGHPENTTTPGIEVTTGENLDECSVSFLYCREK